MKELFVVEMVGKQTRVVGGEEDFFRCIRRKELFHENYRFFIIAMVTNRELERMI